LIINDRAVGQHCHRVVINWCFIEIFEVAALPKGDGTLCAFGTFIESFVKQRVRA